MYHFTEAEGEGLPTKASSRKQKDIFQIGPTRSSKICIKFIFCLFPHLSLKDGRGWVGLGWVCGIGGHALGHTDLHLSLKYLMSRESKMNF